MLQLSDTESIVALSATEMARRIADGEISPSEVVDAHIRRIAATQEKINAVVQPLFERARADAEAADRQVEVARRSGRPLPPLLGVPVTIKDSFDVEGADTTMGLSRRAGQRAARDSVLVARLRAAGAIVLGKTNVSQGMLMHEADNPRFGRTCHPLDARRSPGGSSGGEAAAVAGGDSAMGLASDLGGSTRHPAYSCGLCALKPSTGCLSLVGSHRPLAGMQAIAVQPGPITRSVADLELAMQVLTDDRSVPCQEDETGHAWPDSHRVNIETLRIAWFDDDGYFRPSPAIRRAVAGAAESLAARGAEVTQWQPPDVRSMLRAYLGLITADGLASLRRLVRAGGGPVDRQVARQLRLARIPRPARHALKSLLPRLGQRGLADLMMWTGARSAAAYWELTLAAEEYRQAFQRSLAEAVGGELSDVAVLMPPHGLPALLHGTALEVLPAASYCFLPNLLGWPAGVVPTGEVPADQESDRPPSRDIVERTALKIERGSAGLPVGVQVIAPLRRDDVVIAVMRAVEESRG